MMVSSTPALGDVIDALVTAGRRFPHRMQPCSHGRNRKTAIPCGHEVAIHTLRPGGRGGYAPAGGHQSASEACAGRAGHGRAGVVCSGNRVPAGICGRDTDAPARCGNAFPGRPGGRGQAARSARFFVFATIVLAGQLGAATTMAWLLAGAVPGRPDSRPLRAGQFRPARGHLASCGGRGPDHRGRGAGQQVLDGASRPDRAGPIPVSAGGTHAFCQGSGPRSAG